MKCKYIHYQFAIEFVSEKRESIIVVNAPIRFVFLSSLLLNFDWCFNSLIHWFIHSSFLSCQKNDAQHIIVHYNVSNSSAEAYTCNKNCCNKLAQEKAKIHIRFFVNSKRFVVEIHVLVRCTQLSIAVKLCSWDRDPQFYLSLSTFDPCCPCTAMLRVYILICFNGILIGAFKMSLSSV